MSALPAIAFAMVATSDKPLLSAFGWCAAFVVAIVLMDWIDSKLP